MANHYVQFSELVAIPSSDALAWIISQLDRSGLDTEPPRTYDWRRTDFSQEARSNGFTWSINTNQDGSQDLWIYSADYGNPDDVASFVQAFLQRFSPHVVWTLTFSLTCSKIRVGAFSGGAIVVTAAEIESFNAGAWAARKARRKRRATMGQTEPGATQQS